MAGTWEGRKLFLPSRKLVTGSLSKTYTLNDGAGTVSVTMQNMQPTIAFDWTGRQVGLDTDIAFYPLAWLRSNVTIGGSDTDAGGGAKLPNVVIFNTDPFGAIAEGLGDIASNLARLDVFASLPQFTYGSHNQEWMSTSLYQTDYTVVSDTAVLAPGSYGNLVKQVTASHWIGGNVIELIAMTPQVTGKTTGYALHVNASGTWRTADAVNMISAARSQRSANMARFNRFKTVVLYYDPSTSTLPTGFPTSITRTRNEDITDATSEADFVYCGAFSVADGNMRREVRNRVASFFGV